LILLTPQSNHTLEFPSGVWSVNFPVPKSDSIGRAMQLRRFAGDPSTLACGAFAWRGFLF
jgi:hypothetical protein